MSDNNHLAILMNNDIASPMKHSTNLNTTSAQQNPKMNRMKIADSGAISSRSLKSKTFFSAYTGANTRPFE